MENMEKSVRSFCCRTRCDKNWLRQAALAIGREHMCQFAVLRYRQLVITDHMINRVATNWENGIRTHIFLDEFHTLLEHRYSENFFDSAYRRFRKRNAWVTSLTQNVEYVLDSTKARTMLSNSEFILMLNQAASDRDRLAELLHISQEQLNYVTNARAGNGLAKVGSSLVPFLNPFPKDTELYRLMTTKPSEEF